MIWQLLFAVCIAQGLFLISLIALKGSGNSLAACLISALIIPMLIINFGYFTIHTELVNRIPHAFALQFGITLLIGPLFYFYARSVIDDAFRWKRKYWLHFIPYLLQVFIFLPWWVQDRNYWGRFIEIFLAGNLPVIPLAKVTFIVQDLHLLFYLVITYRLIHLTETNHGSTRYIVPVPSRTRWLRSLTFCFFALLVTLLSLQCFLFLEGKYNPVTNYIVSFITTVIIYFIAYKQVLNPDLISPGFIKKYQAYMHFAGENGERYLSKLLSLMTEEKIFTDPELKLASLARQVELPPHQLSKLINDKFGKSFTDYVNEYRVQEFIRRVNLVQNKTYTLYSIAMDVGFNSKSSFNAAFRKLTGKTPSNYKEPS